MNKSALIVIPTTGSYTLEDAIKSALSQTYSNFEIWVIIDGPQFENNSKEITNKYPTVKTLTLIENTGKSIHGDFYGHRIYAAVSFMFNHDYILYLDHDNMFEHTHVENMINECEVNNWHWCHSLRKIYDSFGNYVCDDDCESLGKWPIYFNNDLHLVDTSTYCIRREVIINIASAWYSGWGGDRRFYSIISKTFPNFGCTKNSTVRYRLDGNENSVTSEFFINGNNVMKQRYPTGFPWRQK